MDNKHMSELDIQQARHQYVVKANQIIRDARFSLSVSQQKLILYLITQIKPTDTDFQLYRISIKDFCEIIGIDAQQGNNYADIKKAIEDIAQKHLWIKIDAKREAMIRWLEKVYINHSAGIIEVRLDSDLKPYLLQLKSHYTQYELFWTLKFKSKYSFRVYELIKCFHFDEFKPYKVKFDIDDIREKLDTPQTYTYQSFKNRVLLPALKEINEHSDKIVSFSEIKGSRNKVEKIELELKTKNLVEHINLLRE